MGTRCQASLASCQPTFPSLWLQRLPLRLRMGQELGEVRQSPFSRLSHLPYCCSFSVYSGSVLLRCFLPKGDERRCSVTIPFLMGQRHSLPTSKSQCTQPVPERFPSSSL